MSDQLAIRTPRQPTELAAALRDYTADHVALQRARKDLADKAGSLWRAAERAAGVCAEITDKRGDEA